MPQNRRFHGERLREAREAAKLTQKLVAEKAGLTPQAISRFEKGGAAPNPATMQLLSNVLQVLPSFFTQGYAAESGEPFFRRLHSASVGSRLQTEHEIGWLVRVISLVRQRCSLPEVQLPSDFLVEDLEAICEQTIAEAATATRIALKLPTTGPIPQLTDAAEKAGIVVVRRQLDDAKQDGASVYPRYLNRPVIVLNAHKASAMRSRFDLAHEIGHMVLHRRIDKRIRRRSADYKRMENQAHAFAADLLMPARSFATCDFRLTPHGLHQHRETWGASVSAMARRCRDLELMSDQAYQSFMIDLSRLGWRSGEPGDAQSIPEYPQLLKRAITHCFNEGSAKWETWSIQLGLPVEKLQRVCGLDEVPPPKAAKCAAKDAPHLVPFREMMAQLQSRQRSRADDQPVSFKIANYRNSNQASPRRDW